jgi:putative transposase
MKKQRFTQERSSAFCVRRKLARRRPTFAQPRHLGSESKTGKPNMAYGGMEVSEAKRLTALEDENARLKKLLAEQMLAAALRELLQKNGGACRHA